jgi:aspartate/methionine/tyrosine aminotransferase
MHYSVNPAMAATDAPPVMEARRWLEGVTFPPDRPLINVSQAAPVAPPPEALREELARVVVGEDAAHMYGPVLGLPELRTEVAQRWSAAYGGRIEAEQVAITSGCNQAFTAALSSLAGAGDDVLIPVPWYFNHAMHCSMAGVRAVPVPTGDDLLPDPELAAALIGPRTRAIVLVSPNNPGGVEYPADLVRAFFELARKHRVPLLLDETYRDFDSRPGAPHDLFANPDWDGTLVHLYSFSKAFRLTGHRVGALLAAPALLREVEKYLDTVTICPNQIGQRAALWGLRKPWAVGGGRASRDPGPARSDCRCVCRATRLAPAGMRCLLCLGGASLAPALARPGAASGRRGRRAAAARHDVPPRRRRTRTADRLCQCRPCRNCWTGGAVARMATLKPAPRQRRSGYACRVGGGPVFSPGCDGEANAWRR